MRAAALCPELLGTESGSSLSSIAVDPIEGRLGHFLRTELQFALGGGRIPDSPTFRLSVTATQQNRVAVVNRFLTEAESATTIVNASYSLVRISDGVEVTSGKVTSSAGFDRSDQRFATLSASKNAEERAARLTSDQIRTRIASALAAGRT